MISSKAQEHINEMIQDSLDVSLIKGGMKLPISIEYISLDLILNTVIEEMSLAHGDRFKIIGNPQISGYSTKASSEY